MRAGPRLPDGALPRWTDWWPIENVRALFPDESTISSVHDERRLAESLGWPTRTMELGHLGHLQPPKEVAEVLTALIDGWTAGPNA